MPKYSRNGEKQRVYDWFSDCFHTPRPLIFAGAPFSHPLTQENPGDVVRMCLKLVVKPPKEGVKTTQLLTIGTRMLRSHRDSLARVHKPLRRTHDTLVPCAMQQFALMFY